MLAEASAANPRIFVVGAALTVNDAGGNECGLSEGDVLRLSVPPAADASSANVEVFASKGQECGRGSTVAVDFTDLQEMQNHMRSNIDQGLQQLQAHKGGLPAPPPSAAAAPTPSSFASIAPPPDPNVAAELKAEAKEADGAEQEVLAEAKADTGAGAGGAPPPAAAAAPAPAEIAAGQTVDQVVAAMGQPKQIVKAGAKQIYVYSDLKITFVNGKVTDVQ